MLTHAHKQATQVRPACAAGNEYEAEAWIHAFVDVGAQYQEPVQVRCSKGGWRWEVLECWGMFGCLTTLALRLTLLALSTPPSQLRL